MNLDHRRAIGFLVLLLALGTALAAPRPAMAGWLAAFIYQGTTVLGGFFFVMLADVIPGSWRASVRSPAAMLAAGMPLLALFCLPILFGMRLIFPWYDGEGLSGFRAFYLTPLAAGARLIVFFAICIWLQARLSRGPNRSLATAALIVFVLLDGLFATDIVLSLDPHFHSSGFGLYFLSLQALTAFSAIVLIRSLGYSSDAMQRSLMGALFLTLLLCWAYFDFMQYFILWSGNLPTRADWFVRRSNGGWSTLVSILVVLRLGPAFLLLFPPIRQNGRALVFFAASTLAGSLIEVAWLVMPEIESPLWAIGTYLLASAGMVLLTSVPLTRTPETDRAGSERSAHEGA